MLDRELNAVLRNKFNWVLPLNRMVKWLGLTPWRSQLEFLLLFLQTVSLSFSRSHMTNKVKVTSARNSDNFQLSWSWWSAKRHGAGILLLKGAASFSITEHHRLGNRKQSLRSGRDFLLLTPPRKEQTVSVYIWEIGPLGIVRTQMNH